MKVSCLLIHSGDLIFLPFAFPVKLFPPLFCFNCSSFCFHQRLLMPLNPLSALHLVGATRPDPSDRVQTRGTSSLGNKADSKRQILTLILSAAGSEARKKRRKGKIYSTVSTSVGLILIFLFKLSLYLLFFCLWKFLESFCGLHLACENLP